MLRFNISVVNNKKAIYYFNGEINSKKLLNTQ